MSKQHDITALIYDKRGRLLSLGKNSFIRTHPLQVYWTKKAKEDPHKIYIHAEIDAIVKCRNLGKAHKIVITRFNSKGEPVNCKPCPACQLAIAHAGIKHIEHT